MNQAEFSYQLILGRRGSNVKPQLSETDAQEAGIHDELPSLQEAALLKSLDSIPDRDLVNLELPCHAAVRSAEIGSKERTCSITKKFPTDSDIQAVHFAETGCKKEKHRY